MLERVRLVVCVCWALMGVTMAQEDVKFGEALDGAKSETVTRRAKLFDQYAGAMERAQEKFQGSGDLINAVKAREEAWKARVERKLGTDPILGLEKLRGVMNVELGKIHLIELKAISELRGKYIASLERKIAQLTKEGKLDAALGVDQRKQKEEARLLEEKKRIAGYGDAKDSGSRTSEQAVKKLEMVKSSVLTGKSAVTGEVVLQLGLHRLRERAVIGIRGTDKKTKKKVSIRGHVVSNAGTAIIGGEVYVHNGLFKANDTKFEKVSLLVELQGLWDINACLLGDCRYRHNKLWFMGRYASKWLFKDCVFTGDFFEEWESIGLTIERCTFDEVSFIPFDYKKDASKEAISDGRVIKGCHFLNCKIPASIALATEDCLFENCTFTNQWGSEFKIGEAIEVTLYYAGAESPTPPKARENIKFVFQPISEAGDLTFGSPVRYSLQRGKLNYQ